MIKTSLQQRMTEKSSGCKRIQGSFKFQLNIRTETSLCLGCQAMLYNNCQYNSTCCTQKITLRISYNLLEQNLIKNQLQKPVLYLYAIPVGSFLGSQYICILLDFSLGWGYISFWVFCFTFVVEFQHQYLIFLKENIGLVQHSHVTLLANVKLVSEILLK